MKKIAIISLLNLLLLTGCQSYGGRVILGGNPSYGYNSPPAHAPAYGQRQQHRYHYYPNAEFYFDIGRNAYFYLNSKLRWTFSSKLPKHLRHHLHKNYVEIEMDDDRPYRRHKHHKKKYKKHKTRYNRKHKEKHKAKKAKKKKYKYRDNYDNYDRY